MYKCIKNQVKHPRGRLLQKQPRDLSYQLFLQKAPSQTSEKVSNTCYQKVVKIFSMLKLKLKEAKKKVKINFTTLLVS